MIHSDSGFDKVDVRLMMRGVGELEEVGIHARAPPLPNFANDAVTLQSVMEPTPDTCGK